MLSTVQSHTIQLILLPFMLKSWGEMWPKATACRCGGHISVVCGFERLEHLSLKNNTMKFGAWDRTPMNRGVDSREREGEERWPLLNYRNSAHFQGDLILLRIAIIMIPNRGLSYLKREYILCVLRAWPFKFPRLWFRSASVSGIEIPGRGLFW